MRSIRLALIGILLAFLVFASAYASHQPGHNPPGQTTDLPDHPAQACSDPYHVQGAGWNLCWQQDGLRVQGIELNQVFFHNESVIWRIGLPFSLTEYERGSPGPFKDVLGQPVDAGVPGFGRGSMQIDSDACPRFLPQGELLNAGRLCVEKRDGVNPAVSLWGRYDLFNYRFIQGYHMDSRGEFQPFVGFGGRLIDGATAGAAGQNHYHHVYWRVDFDNASPGNDSFQAFKHLHDEISLTPTDPPFLCKTEGGTSASMWCDVPVEAKLTHHKESHDKWRVRDSQDLNAHGREKSFEFVVHSDAPADEFSSFDVMALEFEGDSEEIGYEVSSNPRRTGDSSINDYITPPEEITDPVIWVVHRSHHDTRDEDSDSMLHHYAGFTIRPKNFLDENPVEETYP